MEDNKQFKIGTRGSLLAVTQCTIIKNELEKKSNKKFQLQEFITQGDQITDKPLWQLEGKDFFTKELDRGLIDRKIDLVVHSYKDLGSERPDKIELAAITKRTFANDILLIKKEKVQQIKSMQSFIVGTSSPRRIVNTEKNLKDFLPHAKESLKVNCETLRGNVNTRIEKLRSDKYDAIILAHAGVERLTKQSQSRAELTKLLDGLTFMILPQNYFTSSASQGALALECHEEATQDLKEALQTVHDLQTQEEVARERKAFNQYGGGCHLAVGVNVKKIKNFYIHIHNGTLDHNEIKIQKLEGFDFNKYKNKTIYNVIGEKDFLIKKNEIKNIVKNKNIFVTSKYCFHNIGENNNSIWASGNRTMKQLALNGYWVNASAEGLGHEEICSLKNSEAVQIMLGNKPWVTMSHQEAQSEVGEVLPCYTHELNTTIDTELEDDLKSAEIIFWGSKIQFDFYTKKYPSLVQKIHACGLGKTYDYLIEKNIELIPCINMNHLQQEIKDK